MNAAHAPGSWTLRMKDLCAEAGLTRQAIHFYIQEGLLPPGRKTGRNMAFYGPEHVERLHLVRKLQHERFLPLKAIKALLGERDEALEGYSEAQRAFLQAVRTRVGGAAGADRPPVPGADLVARGLIEGHDLEQLVDSGAIAARRDPQTGGITVHAADVPLVTLFGALRDAGITEEAGFTIEDLGLYERTIARLVKQETALVVDRLGTRPPEEVAATIERSIPIINAIIGHLRERRVRDLLATV
ncbi:MAG: MerR family transcriptional regulator [Myxococcales bacterium]|nr:MerR family transcriptional regulator [Myxococcales bacterium]